MNKLSSADTRRSRRPVKLKAAMTSLAVLFAAGVAVFAGAAPASAAIITSQLNCPIVGGTACASATASYGTITFTDVTGGVNIGVGLTSGTTVQDINFNYTAGTTVVPITATVTGGSFSNSSVSVNNSPNGVTLNGSGNYSGKFDVDIPNNGTFTQAGNAFTVALSTSLTATTIANSLDTNGLLDFAVHLQNCGPNGSATCQPGVTGSNSLVVGELPTSSGGGGGGGGGGNVPEPASLLLLGSGLVGFGMLRRRKSV